MARSYEEVIAPLRGGVEPAVAAAVAADMEAAYDLVFGLGDAVSSGPLEASADRDPSVDDSGGLTG